MVEGSGACLVLTCRVKNRGATHALASCKTRACMCMTKLYRLRRELSAPDDMGASWSRPPERMLPPARTAPDVASVAAVSTKAAKTEPALLVAAAAARRLHALEEEATACRLARDTVAGSGLSAARRLAAAASCPPWLLPLPCPAATAAAGGAPPGFSDSSGLTQLFLLEVLASVPAGYKMLVHVDGLGDFQVTVPAGVRVGESFTFEAEAPIDKQPSGAPIEPVPMGLPVQTEPQVPMGLPVPMAAQPVPMGAPVTSAAPVPSASRSGAVSGAAALPAQLGVASPGVVSSVGTALAAMSLARELGVTPQNAWVAAHQGARLAKDLGVTPSAAASAGIAAMNLLAEMQKESISKTARRT